MNNRRKSSHADPLSNDPARNPQSRLYVFRHDLGPISWFQGYRAVDEEFARLTAKIMTRIVYGTAEKLALELIDAIDLDCIN